MSHWKAPLGGAIPFGSGLGLGTLGKKLSGRAQVGGKRGEAEW